LPHGHNVLDHLGWWIGPLLSLDRNPAELA
jgi:hypothetical protein